jgi:ATPase subunit of ABC transporter with duplicated ATPase domains
MLVDNLSISYLTGKPLISNLSFYLNKGDKLALIGEEGNGKSTLIKCLYDKRLVEDYVSIKGTINTLNQKIGYLPQLTPSEILDLGVYTYLTEEILKDHDYDKLGLIYQYFSKFELANELIDNNQLISTLSGGEKVKIQLIKLLINEYDILLLDEPSNDLDIATIRWLENFIVDAKQGVIFISHDELLLTRCATRIVHLQMLKKKNEPSFNLENLSYVDYVSKFYGDYEIQLTKALYERRVKKEKEEVLRKLHSKVEHRLNQVVRDPTQGRLLAKKMKVIKGQERKLEEKELTEIPEIEASINVSFNTKSKLHDSYRIIDIQNQTLQVDDRLLVTNLSLTVIGQQKVGIIGKNGVGKTTFLKFILDYLANKQLKVGYLPQNYLDVLPLNESPISYLQSILGTDKEKEALIRNYLGALKFTKEEMLSMISELSGGQRCKLLIVKLLLDQNDIIVLDEPTRNLSPLSLPKVRELFSSYQGPILSVSHDRMFINSVMTKVYELKDNGLFEVDKEDLT